MVVRAVAGGAFDAVVDGADVGDGFVGVGGGAEGGGGDECAGARESAPGVAAVPGVASHCGHGEGV